MRQDIRKGIKNSFLYKRFAYYQSEGFIKLIEFLENENLIDKFYEECDFNKESLIKDLKNNKEVSIESFFEYAIYSFFFPISHYGSEFWLDKTFCNCNFKEIKNKLL